MRRRGGVAWVFGARLLLDRPRREGSRDRLVAGRSCEERMVDGGIPEEERMRNAVSGWIGILRRRLFRPGSLLLPLEGFDAGAFPVSEGSLSYSQRRRDDENEAVVD